MRFIVLSSVAAALAIAACSTTTHNTFDPLGETGGAGDTAGGTGSGSTLSSGLGGGSLSTGVGAGGGNPNSGCSAAAELIYVLSEDNDLYSFDPTMKAFKKIGPLGCNTSMQPNSMAVDRNATAWVNYVENDGTSDTAGAIFKVSTTDASCQPTSIQLTQGWYRLGMGFSSDKAGGASETLFVAGDGALAGGMSTGLGKIDFATNAVVPIGAFSGALAGQDAELTGTGDARLFGFFTTTPVQVAQIDKTSAAILMTKALPTVETPSAWAFSFWGGDFYLYTSPDPLLNPSRTTNVTRYDPVAGTADTTFLPNIGFIIVGAGVSTCAPIVQPK